MNLALKEAENQRLQAARQRDTAGVSLSSSGTMDGLRSELTALVEKNKIGEYHSQQAEVPKTMGNDARDVRCETLM